MTKEKNTKMETTWPKASTVKNFLVEKQSDTPFQNGNFMEAFGLNLQLGHERRYRHPAMTGFIYGQRKGVGDFFDLREFSRHLKQAYRFVEEIVMSGKADHLVKGSGSLDETNFSLDRVVIFVAKDKSHYKLLKPLFLSLYSVFQNKALKKTTNTTPILLEKWTPGLLTQGRLLDTQKSIKNSVKGGHLVGVQEAVPALIITFGNKLLQQIKREALITKTPLISVVDSDQDPRGITYVIPCNDDNYKGQYFLGRVLLDPFFSCMETSK